MVGCPTTLTECLCSAWLLSHSLSWCFQKDSHMMQGRNGTTWAIFCPLNIRKHQADGYYYQIRHGTPSLCGFPPLIWSPVSLLSSSFLRILLQFSLALFPGLISVFRWKKKEEITTHPPVQTGSPQGHTYPRPMFLFLFVFAFLSNYCLINWVDIRWQQHP